METSRTYLKIVLLWLRRVSFNEKVTNKMLFSDPGDFAGITSPPPPIRIYRVALNQKIRKILTSAVGRGILVSLKTALELTENSIFPQLTAMHYKYITKTNNKLIKRLEAEPFKPTFLLHISIILHIR